MEWVAEDRDEGARLVEVHRRKVGREVDVRDVGDDLVDHLDELVSHFLAPSQCLLDGGAVHARENLVHCRVRARVLNPFFHCHTSVPSSTAMKHQKNQAQIDEDSA